MRIVLIMPAVVLLIAVGATDVRSQSRSCDGFRWGGKCWARTDGNQFSAWLRSHGSSPQRFRSRWPHLASLFGPGWGERPAIPDPCYRSSCADDVVRAVFPAGSERYALAIARCESHMNPHAIGDGGASLGLFQVHWPSWGGLPWVGSRSELLEAWHNARVALRISGGGRDWSPWTCARYVRATASEKER